MSSCSFKAALNGSQLLEKPKAQSSICIKTIRVFLKEQIKCCTYPSLGPLKHLALCYCTDNKSMKCPMNIGKDLNVSLQWTMKSIEFHSLHFHQVQDISSYEASIAIFPCHFYSRIRGFLTGISGFLRAWILRERKGNYQYQFA